MFPNVLNAFGQRLTVLPLKATLSGVFESKKSFFKIAFLCFSVCGCGVKGAPLPREKSVFLYKAGSNKKALSPSLEEEKKQSGEDKKDADENKKEI